MKESFVSEGPLDIRHLDVNKEMAILLGVRPLTYDLLVKSIAYGNHTRLDPIQWGMIESYFVTDSTIGTLPRPKGFKDSRKAARFIRAGLAELLYMLPKEDLDYFPPAETIQLKDPFSAVSRTRRSLAHTNPSPEIRTRFSKGHTGLHLSETHKKNIGDGVKRALQNKKVALR